MGEDKAIRWRKNVSESAERKSTERYARRKKIVREARPPPIAFHGFSRIRSRPSRKCRALSPLGKVPPEGEHRRGLVLEEVVPLVVGPPKRSHENSRRKNTELGSWLDRRREKLTEGQRDHVNGLVRPRRVRG
ncbi:hypothetical protein KM043_014578 [Ampulex compressa]|nr:hypothetical protein KM043_014578 [Ampulex compressa]